MNPRRLQFEQLETRDMLSYVVDPSDYGITEVQPKDDYISPIEWPAYMGFHKDLFVDGGAYLTSLRSYAGEYMWLSMDELLTSSTTLQNRMIVGTDKDTNGALLFPDGQPRYRAVFVNGGSATKHGKSLGSDGRERFQAFVSSGGSFIGSCAGAYIASSRFDWYFGLIPVELSYSGYLSTRHSVVFGDSEFSELFFELSGENQVENIKHYGGPYFDPKLTDSPEIEYFGRVTDIGRNLKDSPYLLSYKPDDATGRVVVQPSHPEYARDGLQLSLMQSILTYALEGTVSIPDLKGTLQPNDTANGTVGDGQYHRWIIDVPPGTGTVDITLSGLDSDMFVQFDSPANSESYLQTGSRVLIAGTGRWHVSVFGDHETANGVEYTINVSSGYSWYYNETITVVSQPDVMPASVTAAKADMLSATTVYFVDSSSVQQDMLDAHTELGSPDNYVANDLLDDDLLDDISMQQSLILVEVTGVY